jgi:hypothetical protein
MKKVVKTLKEQEEQLVKFKAAAREYACEEAGGMYDTLLRRVAQLKPMMRRTPTSEFAKKD